MHDFVMHKRFLKFGSLVVEQKKSPFPWYCMSLLMLYIVYREDEWNININALRHFDICLIQKT